MATSHKYTTNETRWTYGAELEFVDWPRNEPLPEGMAVDDGNYTSVNNNGIAVDGKGKTYHLGGEILTAPSVHLTGPADQMTLLQKKWPEMAVNYRTGLNVHVRVPGLRDDLKKLKRLQAFVHAVMPELLHVIDPIPIPTAIRSVGWRWNIKEAEAKARRCFTVRKKDHHTLLHPRRLALQMKARTPQAFLEAEAVHESTGEVHWALAARTCVNLRQLMQTDTIEFRHFFMPATAGELANATIWCHMFLEAAFEGENVTAKDLLREFDFNKRAWPVAMPYDPWLDEGFFFTSPHYFRPDIVAINIETWLNRIK